MAVAIGEGGGGASGDFVRRAGDQMTGNLEIAGAETALVLHRPGVSLSRLRSAAQSGLMGLEVLHQSGGTQRGPLLAGWAFVEAVDASVGVYAPAVHARTELVSAGPVTVNNRGIAYNHTHSPGSLGNVIGFRWASPNIVGNIDATGNVVVGTLSDRRLKTGIADLPGDRALAQVLALRPVTYLPLDLDGSAVAPAVEHVGLIADEVEQVVPTAVGTGEGADALSSLNHGEIVPLLIGAVQELSARVAELEARQ
jgi:hypothetical protein